MGKSWNRNQDKYGKYSSLRQQRDQKRKNKPNKIRLTNDRENLESQQ